MGGASKYVGFGARAQVSAERAICLPTERVIRFERMV